MIILKLKILELTKENSSEYIDDVAMLEKKVLETMEKEGKIGQLFISRCPETESSAIGSVYYSRSKTIYIQWYYEIF